MPSSAWLVDFCYALSDSFPEVVSALVINASFVLPFSFRRRPRRRLLVCP
jgi:hypothetical protein